MFRRWRFVACVCSGENVMKRAMQVKRYIEKHIGMRVECKLETQIRDFEETITFDMYMRLNDNEAAFVRGLTGAEGFYARATKD